MVPSQLARFRELKGIGAAAESKLHAAGVGSWQALASVLDTLSRLKDLSAETLRALRDEAGSRAEVTPTETGAGNGERVERFVVTVARAPDGTPSRSTVTDVRSNQTDTFPGLPPESIVGFIGRRTGAMPAPPGEARPAPAIAAKAPVADSEETPISFGASPHRRDIIVVDAGKAIGGGRPISVLRRWDTSAIETPDDFRYRAMLAGRPYGGRPGAEWHPLGGQAGTAHPGDVVDLRFDDVEVPEGVVRLELTVELEPERNRIVTTAG
jgi:hypothetical protein